MCVSFFAVVGHGFQVDSYIRGSFLAYLCSFLGLQLVSVVSGQVFDFICDHHLVRPFNALAVGYLLIEVSVERVDLLNLLRPELGDGEVGVGLRPVCRLLQYRLRLR
jgi:hypothetical protein